MNSEKTSFKGALIRDLIAGITSAPRVGEYIKTGKFRMNPIEPVFFYGPRFHCEKIHLEKFSLEHLKKSKDKNSEYAILQLHGGAYIGPMKNAYRRFSIAYQELCEGSDVVTIDYRVAPKNPYPAALEDAVRAYRYMTDENGYEPEKIFIAGDSAGGGLSLALSMYLRDCGFRPPAALILMSPWTDLTNSGESRIKNFDIDPLFGKTTHNMLYHSSYIGDHDPRNPYISPWFGSYEDLPPMLIQAGTHEVLLSDSEHTAAQVKAAGGSVKLSIYEGMFHLFQMSGEIIPESKAAWKEISVFFQDIIKASHG